MAHPDDVRRARTAGGGGEPLRHVEDLGEPARATCAHRRCRPPAGAQRRRQLPRRVAAPRAIATPASPASRRRGGRRSARARESSARSPAPRRPAGRWRCRRGRGRRQRPPPPSDAVSRSETTTVTRSASSWPSSTTSGVVLGQEGTALEGVDREHRVVRHDDVDVVGPRAGLLAEALRRHRAPLPAEALQRGHRHLPPRALGDPGHELVAVTAAGLAAPTARSRTTSRPERATSARALTGAAAGRRRRRTARRPRRESRRRACAGTRSSSGP